MTSPNHSVSTGISRLDDMLGGGLVPGTLTVLLGATGIGKTQLGLLFANEGLKTDGERGIIFDMTSRGDSQSHADYAKRLCDWNITDRPVDLPVDIEQIWDPKSARFDSFHLFRRSGKRVSTRDLDTDQLREWKADLNRKLTQTIAFFYGNFIHGVRRCVIDGIEPTDRASESFQFDLFEYVYHQILRKEAAWLARDLLRVEYLKNEPQVKRHDYDHRRVTCLMLCTSHEVLLDELVARPIETGDVLSNANTIIVMGKIRDGLKMRRALHVAKHRGRPCDESIVPFEITETGFDFV